MGIQSAPLNSWVILLYVTPTILPTALPAHATATTYPWMDRWEAQEFACYRHSLSLRRVGRLKPAAWQRRQHSATYAEPPLPRAVTCRCAFLAVTHTFLLTAPFRAPRRIRCHSPTPTTVLSAYSTLLSPPVFATCCHLPVRALFTYSRRALPSYCLRYARYHTRLAMVRVLAQFFHRVPVYTLVSTTYDAYRYLLTRQRAISFVPLTRTQTVRVTPARPARYSGAWLLVLPRCPPNVPIRAASACAGSLTSYQLSCMHCTLPTYIILYTCTQLPQISLFSLSPGSVDCTVLVLAHAYRSCLATNWTCNVAV